MDQVQEYGDWAKLPDCGNVKQVLGLSDPPCKIFDAMNMYLVLILRLQELLRTQETSLNYVRLAL
jgi:hypothetical protein